MNRKTKDKRSKTKSIKKISKRTSSDIEKDLSTAIELLERVMEELHTLKVENRKVKLSPKEQKELEKKIKGLKQQYVTYKHFSDFEKAFG